MEEIFSISSGAHRCDLKYMYTFGCTGRGSNVVDNMLEYNPEVTGLILHFSVLSDETNQGLCMTYVLVECKTLVHSLTESVDFNNFCHFYQGKKFYDFLPW